METTKETKTDRSTGRGTNGTQDHGASGLVGGGSCGGPFFADHGGSTNN